MLESIKNTGNPRVFYLLKFIGKLGKQTIPDICINYNNNISELTELIRIAENGTAIDSYILAEAYYAQHDVQNAYIWYKNAHDLGIEFSYSKNYYDMSSTMKDSDFPFGEWRKDFDWK